MGQEPTVDALIAHYQFFHAAGRVLRQERERLGWSLTDLAHRAGVVVEAIPHYERGRRGHPALDDWRRLVAALGLEWEDFEGRAGQLAGVPLDQGVLDAQHRAMTSATYEPTHADLAYFDRMDATRAARAAARRDEQRGGER